MTFYVYVDYTLEESPRPFYVGKGNEDRVNLMKRNPRHTAIAEAYGMRREIVMTTIVEQVALNREIELIAQLMTRDDLGGWGANFTDGGDGTSGWVPSEETRRKISQANRGHRHTAEARRKMSENRKKNFTEETRQRYRAAKLGKKLTEEHKRKIGEAGRRRKLQATA